MYYVRIDSMNYSVGCPKNTIKKNSKTTEELLNEDGLPLRIPLAKIGVHLNYLQRQQALRVQALIDDPENYTFIINELTKTMPLVTFTTVRFLLYAPRCLQ